jgi:hypothetical protein
MSHTAAASVRGTGSAKAAGPIAARQVQVVRVDPAERRERRLHHPGGEGQRIDGERAED